MCGRFTLRTPTRDIVAVFQLDEAPDLSPRYNIAPTQLVPAVRLDAEHQTRELVLLHWGLIPFWADDRKIGNRMINARAEGIATKPAFRRAFKSQRCLVVADGFYEWQKTGGKKKQPYYVRLKEDLPFGFAGLWEHWKDEGDTIESCTIITTAANSLMQPIHDRMPVIVAPDEYALWLDPEFQDTHKLQDMLQPYDADQMEAYPVSTAVNNPRNEIPACVESVEPEA
jgi:putative SOS response-associated peptidase YedK